MSCILYKVRPLCESAYACEQLIWVCPTEDCILPTMFSDFVHISTDSKHGTSDTHDLPGDFCFSTPLLFIKLTGTLTNGFVRRWITTIFMPKVPLSISDGSSFYKSDTTPSLLLWGHHFFAMEWWSQPASIRYFYVNDAARYLV